LAVHPIRRPMTTEVMTTRVAMAQERRLVQRAAPMKTAWAAKRAPKSARSETIPAAEAATIPSRSATSPGATQNATAMAANSAVESVKMKRLIVVVMGASSGELHDI